MLASLVEPDDVRIAPLLARIVPAPARERGGQHILFMQAGQREPVAYLHAMPLLWLGGVMHVVERSHWVYMKCFAARAPFFAAGAWRAWYALPEFPALWPLTLIVRPTPQGEAPARRVGFAEDTWLAMPGTLTCHVAAPEYAPFAAHRPPAAAKNPLPAV